MSDYSPTSGTASSPGRTYTVTAFFDNRGDAERAVESLVEEGLDRDCVRLMPGSERDPAGDPGTRAADGTTSFPAHGHSGFWESLADLFLPDRDREVYAEGLHRGGYLVVVETNDANHDAAVDILDDEGTIDMDERADSWRAEGWTSRWDSTAMGRGDVPGSAESAVLGGGNAPRMAGASGAAGTVRASEDTLSRGTDVRTAGSGTTAFDSASERRVAGERGTEEVIPVVEETLRVGKRAVEGGHVRVRSYVRETPAEAQVNLRDEHVRIERRPVDRPVGAGDEAFQDRTIDVQERTEEPVVSKEARVREEVVVNRDVEERNQTVSDKVRRTEVEVEDDRAARGTGTFDQNRR